MESFDIQYIYEIIDRYSATARRIADNTKKIKLQMDRASKSARDFGSNMMKVGRGLMLRVTTPILALGTGAVLSSAKLETLRTSFIGMLGDAKKAADTVKVLNEFTAKTPFQLDQVATSARQLLAAGSDVSELPDTLQLLGDIASAANIPLSDMAQIFAKAKNKGKAMTEEILQMSDRGIPIIAELSTMLGVTKDKIFEMASQSQLSFPILVKAMKRMQGEGGFAFKAMILQSQTMAGLFSTLKDNVMLMASSFGDILLPKLKSFAVRAIEIAQSIRTWVAENPKLAKMVIIIAGITAAIPPLIVALGAVVFAIGTLMSPITLIVLGISALSGLLVALAMNWNTVVQAFQNVAVFRAIGSIIEMIKLGVDGLISALGFLVDKMQNSAITKVMGKLGSVGNFMAGGFAGFGGTIDVNVNAPKGSIKSVATQSKTKNLKLGANMGNI